MSLHCIVFPLWQDCQERTPLRLREPPRRAPTSLLGSMGLVTGPSIIGSLGGDDLQRWHLRCRLWIGTSIWSHSRGSLPSHHPRFRQAHPLLPRLSVTRLTWVTPTWHHRFTRGCPPAIEHISSYLREWYNLTDFSRHRALPVSQKGRSTFSGP
ncbi:hypothetical protein BO82DRAFT_17215 [Aspergillus uvarum CBS 121591]|uniref:Uncharacterized protein n=1 Tax=Aspergillus uvarum CBS 121591 TaxID=1448315 RepID=A0A319CMT2_9EURO|nr:hypothetical protein BO82DRAFT_17215 [Aspergillus uvarum CBS 121591]PYH84377.1 hypothetical protein BO82DRAFT_17215 [Aspergillus uvarum CBS 121591]